MRRLILVALVSGGLGLTAGLAFSDAKAGDTKDGGAATYEYEVVAPLLTASKTKNRQKIEETIAGKAKFGWKLAHVEEQGSNTFLYFERMASE